MILIKQIKASVDFKARELLLYFHIVSDLRCAFLSFFSFLFYCFCFSVDLLVVFKWCSIAWKLVAQRSLSPYSCCDSHKIPIANKSSWLVSRVTYDGRPCLSPRPAAVSLAK